MRSGETYFPSLLLGVINFCMASIGILDFVRRQTAESHYDHFDGSWDELLALTQANWERRTISPHNPEVMLVPMPAEVTGRFYGSMIEVTPETPLRAVFAPRAAGEDPYIQVMAVGGEKQPARRAEIILYSHDILAADGDAPPTREADYYIVSINAYVGSDVDEGPEPMSPMTMARNFLRLKGGTQPPVPYTAEEFARSIVYWSKRARIAKPD